MEDDDYCKSINNDETIVVNYFDNPFFNMNGKNEVQQEQKQPLHSSLDKKTTTTTTTTTTSTSTSTTAIISTNTSIDSNIMNGADITNNNFNKNKKYPAIESDDQLIKQKNNLKSPIDDTKLLMVLNCLQNDGSNGGTSSEFSNQKSSENHYHHHHHHHHFNDNFDDDNILDMNTLINKLGLGKEYHIQKRKDSQPQQQHLSEQEIFKVFKDYMDNSSNDDNDNDNVHVNEEEEEEEDDNKDHNKNMDHHHHHHYHEENNENHHNVNRNATDIEQDFYEKVESITQTFSFVSDIIDSLQNAFEDGDVWRNDTENEQFLKSNYSDFLQRKSDLLTLIKIYGRKRNLESLLQESVEIDQRFESLKKQLEFYKIKNEQFNSERLSKLQKEYNGASDSDNGGKSINSKFKKVFKIFKTKFNDGASSIGSGSGRGGSNVNNVNSNKKSRGGKGKESINQIEEEEDEEDEEDDEDESKYQQNFEIKVVNRGKKLNLNENNNNVGENNNNNNDNNDGQLSLEEPCTAVTESAVVETITCSICFLDDIEDIFEISQCGHRYCSECIAQYLKTNILSRKVYIPCPHLKCTSWFQYGQIKYLVDEHTFNKYEEFTFSLFLMKSPNYKWCPSKTCENAVYGEVENPRTRCSNKECNFDFCFNCETEWHHNSTCEQYQIWKLENTMVDTTYSQWTKTTDFKPCPKCKSPIERIAGCAHVTCGSCEYQFCWQCNKKFTPNHFNSLNFFGCPGLQNKKVSNSRRIAYKSMIGAGVIFGGIVVIGVGVPTVIVGLIPYGGYKIFRMVRKNNLKNKQNK